MMNCYLREINKILRYCTLCKSVLKCGFPTKGIKLTRFILFEALEVLQLWDISVLTILAGTTWKFSKYKWDYGIKKISVLDKLVRLCICSQHRVFPFPWWYLPVGWKHSDSQSGRLVLYADIIIFTGAVVVCHS